LKKKLPPMLEIIGNEIILWDKDLASILYNKGFFGKPLGLRKTKPGKLNRPLILSFFEALYLGEYGKLNFSLDRKKISIAELRSYAGKVYEGFDGKYTVYKDFRKLGFIVKPGMKFGGDFVIYRKGPGFDHSHWVVQVEDNKTKINAIKIVRASRLASSVKKQYLISTANEENNLRYYSFEREKI